MTKKPLQLRLRSSLHPITRWPDHPILTTRTSTQSLDRPWSRGEPECIQQTPLRLPILRSLRTAIPDQYSSVRTTCSTTDDCSPATAECRSPGRIQRATFLRAR